MRQHENKRESSILEAAYGVRFPSGFFAFFDFAQVLGGRGLALDTSVLGIRLGRVFDVFRTDLELAAFHPAAQSRYPLDPPEFVTLLHGQTDGHHWGYWVDDPGHPAFPVASYYHSDAFAISVDGGDLFEAMRVYLEQIYRDSLDYLRADPSHAAEYQRQLGELDAIRAVLCTYGTGERTERGSEYLDIYIMEREPTIPTADGMGIMAPPETYRPLAGHGVVLDPMREPAAEEVERLGDAALLALAEGYPATALKLGKDLWARPRYFELSCKLLDAAYEALERPVLRRMLALARAARAQARGA